MSTKYQPRFIVYSRLKSSLGQFCGECTVSPIHFMEEFPMIDTKCTCEGMSPLFFGKVFPYVSSIFVCGGLGDSVVVISFQEETLKQSDAPGKEEGRWYVMVHVGVQAGSCGH